MSWQEVAACSGADTELFFSNSDRRMALEYCVRCPVVSDCLSWANSFETGPRDTYGIYGGLTAEDRITLRLRQIRLAHQIESRHKKARLTVVIVKRADLL